jgi:hypothetical protein
MAHLWLFEYRKKRKKRITEATTVSDPYRSPDATQITYTRGDTESG